MPPSVTLKVFPQMLPFVSSRDPRPETLTVPFVAGESDWASVMTPPWVTSSVPSGACHEKYPPAAAFRSNRPPTMAMLPLAVSDPPSSVTVPLRSTTSGPVPVVNVAFWLTSRRPPLTVSVRSLPTITPTAPVWMTLELEPVTVNAPN